MRLAAPGQYFTAARAWIVSYRLYLRLKTPFGVKHRIGRTQRNAGMLNQAQAAPLAAASQNKYVTHRLLCQQITLLRHYATVFVFSFTVYLANLFDQHQYALQHIQRLEPSNHQRFTKLLIDEVIRRSADHHTDVTGREKGVNTHIVLLQKAAQRGHQTNVLAKHGEIRQALAASLLQRDGGDG